MGNSPSSPPEYRDAVDIFTSSEQKQIVAIYSGIKGPEKQLFDEHDFKRFCSGALSTQLVHHLYSYLLTCINHDYQHQKVTYEMFTVFLASILKGSKEQHTSIVTHLIQPNAQQRTMERLLQYLSDLLTVYSNTMLSTKEFTTWNVGCPPESVKKLSLCLAQDMNVEDDGLISMTDIENWLSTCGLATYILESVFHYMFPISHLDTVDCLSRRQPLFPQTDNVDWDEYHTILDVPAILLLSYHLPHELRTPWRPLYNSWKHGESFSTLMKFVKNEGPCLFVLQDMDGYIFGGFATESLSIRPQFVGNSYSFLFSLHPHMRIYTCTGHNENYLYLNLGQETLPNGLGFGGQLSYFGLWLDHNFGSGHCKATPTPCSTYGSPQLSAKESFLYTHLEVWGLGQDPSLIKHGSDDEDESVPGSILDKNPEAKVMMSLLNRGPCSEGLRDTDQQPDMHEQHTITGN